MKWHLMNNYVICKNVNPPTFCVGIKDKVKHSTTVITQSNTDGKKKLYRFVLLYLTNVL